LKVERFFAVGITGGIASGKSIASDYLADRYKVYDADQMVHQLYRTDMELIDSIGRVFGPLVIRNGQVDREKLREIIFRDRRLLPDLNSLVHPIVGKHILDAIEKHRLEKTRGLFVIPLLCENNWNQKLDGSLLITCAVEVQVQRLLKRNKFTREQAMIIITSQMPLEKKEKLCTWVIKNEASPEELFARLDEWEHIL
tara:strand:+ start:771 stop:1364 length:594 start_codon:yes stop_codon:yes gene_type:complete